MPSITTHQGLSIHYQTFGRPENPAVMLIMGLGAQMTVWPDELIQGLLEKDLFVVRFDNRDVGLSSQLDELGNANLIKAWLSQRLPIKAAAPYVIDDMAQDALALLDALKIKKAHLVGASMGGMIAQNLAAHHRKRVASLTSIMSTTSRSGLPGSDLSVLLRLAKRPKGQSRSASIRYNVKMNRLIGSPGYPTDDLTLWHQAGQNFDRANNPAGFKRQLAAITASGDRSHLLKRIKARTLVIHGSHDPIIPLAAGEDTANTIRKSKLKVVQGMGHDFPIPLAPKLAKWIARHVWKTERKLVAKKLEKIAKAATTA